MTTLTSDTHKAVKALREAGADEPLAEVRNPEVEG